MNEEIEVKFATRLRELRKEKGLSQKALGDLIGYTKTSISDWEREESQPNFTTLIKLVRILNTTADYLLGITDIEE